MSEISAYHEAGHAFIAIYVGARVRSVTIEPDWDDGPERYADIQVEWPLDHFTERELHEKSVLVALAGPVAEMIHSGEPYHPGFVAEWAADWKLAWEAAAVSQLTKVRELLPRKQKAVAEEVTTPKKPARQNGHAAKEAVKPRKAGRNRMNVLFGDRELVSSSEN